MSIQLSAESAGIPIALLAASEFENWLEQQNDHTKNWLTANHYQGKGHCLIPTPEGRLASVVYTVATLDDFFIAGDLPLQLPEGVYCLDSDTLSVNQNPSNEPPGAIELRFAIAWGLACYRFESYKKHDKPLPVLGIASQALLDEAKSFISSITLVRDLVNTPASDMMPENLSHIIDQMADEFDATAQHIIGEQLLSQNYPVIHAVGRASSHAPRLIDLRWGDENAPKVTLVGKGVCFDSGGLDIKPTAAMRLMKKDMGGAAHVMGLARLIMSQNLPVRLRVLVPAAENAVSANAFRPGDVLKTRKGLSVEIDNTDAEGRLVLCDALTEADSESPDIIIDFATLTGACRVALGTELPGMFTNDNPLAAELIASGLNVSDPVWQLPLHAPYQDMLKSDIADTLNSAPSGFGGAITAALYLQLFVSDTTSWVHFDVMAWNNRKLPGRPVGGEAFGIRAVFDFLKQRYLRA